MEHIVASARLQLVLLLSLFLIRINSSIHLLRIISIVSTLYYIFVVCYSYLLNF